MSIVQHVNVDQRLSGERTAEVMGNSSQRSSAFGAVSYSPLMTREAFAQAVGLPVGVLTAQAERGYWPQITIGRRVFINVEAVRIHAAERAEYFVLSRA